MILVLKLDGIEGESTLPGHTNEITVTAATFATEQAGVAAARDAALTGFAAGKATFSPLVISKNSDKASPQLFLRSALGTSIKNAKLSFLLAPPNNTSGPYVEFFTIRLSGVFVTKYSVGASNNDETSFEEVTLFYKQVLITFTPPVGQPFTTGFDLKTNKAISQLDQ